MAVRALQARGSVTGDATERESSFVERESSLFPRGSTSRLGCIGTGVARIGAQSVAREKATFIIMALSRVGC